ncbi:hypothetical protein PG996_011373 [Apiospora saccharicola]|uniref:Uncharacterized protein n=1 Tax=Apiospora saccharicola TaxID=335842 RepID=A0ABR1UEW2_9PEZI
MANVNSKLMIMLQHNASNDTPSGGSTKSKVQSDVIDLISDSEDDGTPPPLTTALKRRASNISGFHEANPRPIKKPSLTRGDTTPQVRKPSSMPTPQTKKPSSMPTPQARKPSSVPTPQPRKPNSIPNGKIAQGNMSDASRLEVAQKQTRLANGKVAELEAKLRDVNAELHATKNKLSHRDSEVTSYQHMEAELLRTTRLLSFKETELEEVAKKNIELAEQAEQVTSDNQKLLTQLADTARDTEAHVASRAGEELAAAKAKQLETEALLLEYREKAPRMAEMEKELEELRKAVAESDARYISHKDEFDQAREAHRDLVYERDEAIALVDSYKEHIDALKESITAANVTLEDACTVEEARIARITQLEEEIHDLETVRDGMESTNEEIMTKLGNAEAEIKAGKEREKVSGEKKKEEIAELLNEIAAVKVEVILLTDQLEELETHHSQEISKAAMQTDSLKEQLLDSEERAEKLQNKIDQCSICRMNYQERAGLWQVCQDIRAMIRSHREELY